MTVRKRLLRKPFTTALWLLLTVAMSAFLLLGIALYLSTDGMVRDLDENHTAIAARMDPPRLLTGEAQKREFTKEDAAWFEGLSSVKALRIHTVSAASSPLFHLLVEMNRHEGWRSNGDRTPYCHAVLSGTVVWIGQDQSDDYFSPGYLGGLGDSVDSGDLEQTVEMTVELEEVLLLGKEYVDSLAESALRYRKQFLVEFTPQDEAAASYFRQGERYVFSGYFDPGALLGISMDVFMEPTVMLLHLGGTRSGQGFLDERCAGQFLCRRNAGGESQKGSCGTQEKRIDGDGYHCDQSLLARMGNICARGSVRCRTDAGFIGIEAALDAVYHAGTGKAASDSAEIKGIGQNHLHYMGKQCRVGENDDQGNGNVGKAHHRDNDLRDTDDLLAASHDAGANGDGKNQTDDGRRDLGIIEAVGHECGLQIIGAEQVEAKTVGEQHEDGKNGG